MHKLLRFYNQNRRKIWIAILAIAFGIVIIQLLNNFAKEDNKKQVGETTLNNVVSYKNESQTITSNQEVNDKFKEEFGNVIDEFFTYCINHQPEMAYDLLSNEIKSKMYPSEVLFEKLYYQDKFEGNKQYSFQSWSIEGSIYVYQVKIFDNLLSSGTKKDEYIEDYITIVPEDDSYHLNVNSYLGNKLINKKGTNDSVTVEVANCDIYLDYQIYTFRVKNNTDQKLLMDTGKNTNTTFLLDDKNNKLEALLYENTEEDLILNPQEAKTITIKFSAVYRSNMLIKSVSFDNIVNYDNYKQGKEIDSKQITVEI